MNNYINFFRSHSFNLLDLPPPFGITCCAIAKRPQCSPQRTILNLISCISVESEKGGGEYSALTVRRTLC